jgi:glutamate racemase
MAIALFDSGIGGLSVLHEARNRLPNKDFLYFADTLHVPYGTKPKEQVKDFILNSVHTIMEQSVEALVIACNTATSIAIRELRSMYSIPIIGMEPAVKPAVQMNRNSGRRVLVVATPLTLRESKYNELINRVDDLSIVDSLPLPELVGYCEQLRLDGPEIESYFHEKLAPFHLADYGTIVLGCTHFPFYRRVLARILPEHMRIIDGSFGTVKRLEEVLAVSAADGAGNVRFQCSDADSSYVEKMENALRLYGKMDRE